MIVGDGQVTELRALDATILGDRWVGVFAGYFDDAEHTLHSFATLMTHLGEIVRNTCKPCETAGTSAVFDLTTTPNTTQARALQLLEGIKPTAATQM